MDKELHQDLLNATHYYQILEEISEKKNSKESEIYALKSNFNQEKERKDKPFERLSTVGIIACVACGIFWFAALLVLLTDEEFAPNDGTAMLLFIPLTLVAVLLLIFSKVQLRKNEVTFEEIKRRTVLPQIEALEKEISKITEAGQLFIKSNQNLIEFLPNSYRNIQATSYMLLAIKNGRADTLKEVFNLYEEQLHRWKLEDAARQSAEAQEYLLLAVEELNAQQAETNARLRSIEFMQYLNQQSNE